MLALNPEKKPAVTDVDVVASCRLHEQAWNFLLHCLFRLKMHWFDIVAVVAIVFDTAVAQL